MSSKVCACATAGCAVITALLGGWARPAHAQAAAVPPPAVARPDKPQEEEATRASVVFRAGPLELAPVLLMQVQAIPYVGEDAFLQAGDPAERGGFRFRRARFGVEGRLFKFMPFSLNVEHSTDVDAIMTLHDAWFGYDRYSYLQVFAGLQDVPFSRYALTGAGDTALVERPFGVRALAPFHQLGLRVEGHLWNGQLNYFVGLYNGLQRTEQFFTGYVENAAILGNRFDGLTYSGRVTSEPLGPIGKTMADLSHSPLRVAAGASGFYSDGGTRGILGLGGDFLLHYRGWHALGEFLANHTAPKLVPTQPTNQTAETTSLGAVGEVGYVPIKDRFGVALRFEWVDPDVSVKNEQDGWMLTGGVSYYLWRGALKAGLDYTHREELHGQSVANESVVLQLQLQL